MPKVDRGDSAALVVRIGKLIRARRDQMGFSLDALSDESGVTRATIHSLESGRGNPCVGTLSRLCVALRCKLIDLLC